MKKSRLLGAVCAITLSVLATSVNANSIWVSLPSSSLNTGDSFQAQILGDFPNGLFTGGVHLSWNANEQILNGVTLNLPVDPAFSCPGSPSCPPNTSSMTYVSWGNFSGVIAPGAPAGTLMATLDFTWIGNTNPLTCYTPEWQTYGYCTFPSINIADGSDISGGWFDASGNVITPTFIPIPASLWLFGTGLLGLIGVARRRMS